METILWKIGMDNSMEKGGLDWANSWSLRMSGEQRDTYGMTKARERESFCSEAKQIRLAARNTNLWNNPFMRYV